MKQFLVRLSIFFLLPGFILGSAWIYILTASHWENFGIVNFQVQKLIRFKKRHFNVVFIGDSSGGNAIKTDKSKTLNLCLTGSFGYEGVGQFIDIIDRYITYDTLVIINTIDIPTRHIAEEANWLPNIYSGNILHRVDALRKSLFFFKPIIKDAVKHNFYFNKPYDTQLDYLVDDKKTKKKINVFDTTINPVEVAELVKLERIVKDKKIPYFLFFGPSLPYDHSYMEGLKKQLLQNNISHQLNEPFLLDSITVGNSEDHVYPDFADLSTQYYRNLMNRSK